jgi:hypothetical protein
LREAAPYIDDDGFAARVLQQLPPRRSSRDLLRAAIILGMTLLASGVAYVVSGGGRFVSVTLERLAALPALWVFVLALGAGLMMTAVGAIAALSKSRVLQT